MKLGIVKANHLMGVVIGDLKNDIDHNSSQSLVYMSY